MKFSRRDWLAAAFATPLARGFSIVSPARPGPPLFKLSLAAYSLRKYLDFKKPGPPPMTLNEFCEYAAALGLGAVELTSYYFANTTPQYLARIKNLCTRLGLDVSGTAVGNNFCVTDAVKRADEVKKVQAWLDHSAYLGAKTMRVFAGAVAKGDTEDAARDRTIECLHEVCEHAAKVGVIVALENHGGITATPEQLLKIVHAVKHDWFGVNLDTFNFRTADPYADVAKVAPHAVTVQMKTEVHPAAKPKEPANFARLLDILRQAQYRGYVALEYEAAEEPKTAIPRAVKTLQELIAGN